MKFFITPDQEKIINDWHRLHECAVAREHPELGEVNGTLWFCVSHSSGIGPAVKGLCQCGKSIKVTDYKSW